MCRRGRSATSRIITISTAGSIRCSSMPTGSTPAPISKVWTSRSTMRNSPRSAISQPSLCRRRTSARSTSAATGADWHSISPNSAAPASPASRCRGSNGSAPANARLKRASRARSSSAWRTIATWRRNSTGSSRSACSSTSASSSTTLFSEMLRPSGRRRRHAAAYHRPLRGAERHQSLDRQIHLLRRLNPGAVGDAAVDRAIGPSGHRH